MPKLMAGATMMLTIRTAARIRLMTALFSRAMDSVAAIMIDSCHCRHGLMLMLILRHATRNLTGKSGRQN